MVSRLAAGDPELAAFVARCRQTGSAEVDIERTEKLGRALGFDAVHPLTGEPVPLWVANFVLMSYGTGAVMVVPAHDQRDYEFARKYDVGIRQVIVPASGGDSVLDGRAYTGHGVLVNSGEFDGLDFESSVDAIATRLERRGRGRRRVNYRLRDWGVSRQRYWGCPIPMVYDEAGAALPVDDLELPVVLPEQVEFQGTRSPLAALPEFLDAALPGGAGRGRRETDTFDTFFESSWYYARFCCPGADAMLDARADYWLPVDRYVGGIEHAVLHLLYARFFHKLMRDEGLVHCDEPFVNLLTQGMVLKDGSKMSKSTGNTVDPQEMIDRHGADTVRLFMMFAAPPDQALEWNDDAVAGARRFLRRFHDLVRRQRRGIVELGGAGRDLLAPARDVTDAACSNLRAELHALLERIDRDYARLRFNTVVAACMEWVNALDRFDARRGIDARRDPGRQRLATMAEGVLILVRVLAPIVPHLAHYAWRRLELPGDVLDAPWPTVDAGVLARDRVRLAVQVNGRRRAEILVARDADDERITAAALADEAVARNVGGRALKKAIVVPGRLVNLVV